MKPNTILQFLKAHQLALGSEESLVDGHRDSSSSRQVRCGNVNDGKDKFGDHKPSFHVPKWPKGL